MSQSKSPQARALLDDHDSPGETVNVDADTRYSDKHVGPVAETNMKAAALAVLFALLASPCVAQTASGEIEKSSQQYLEALNEGDAAMLASMSTERAILLPPNAEMIEGREAIEKYWRGVFAAGLKDVSMRTVRVDAYGADAAREIGRIRLNAPAPRDVLEGKYIIVWRKRGENWLLDSAIWNFTLPAVQ